MTLQENIIVSICCLTYNQKGSIEKAINSFLMQNTDFRFEIFIHDDASNDGTSQIIQKYQRENPERIRLLIQPENLYSKGKSLYEIYTRIAFPQLHGKYIAICEGDDYWTDPFKLQKQVDFLESNPDYSVCFHNAGFTGDTETDYYEHANYFRDVLTNRSTFDFSDLIRNNFIPNCTVVYRNCFENFPELFKNNVFPDWPLHIIFLQNGKIGYINEMMAVHHKRSNGIWEGLSLDARMTALYGFYYDLLIFAGEKYHQDILNALHRHAKNYKVPDLKTLFDIGFSLGLKQQRLQNEVLQSELKLIYSSYTWKTANNLRVISEKILPKETLQRKLAAGIFGYSLKLTKAVKNLISGGIHRLKEKNQKLKTVKITNKPWPADKPLVSVIIPNYNYGKYILETIDSVLTQTFQNIEVIVVDGGSDDTETIEVLKQIDHPKIRVFLREGRHLVGSNRNFGIEKALGKYVCCLDADDIIEPTYLEKAMFYLEAFLFDVVYPWVQSFGDDTVLWKTERATYELLTQSQNVVATSAVFLRYAWLEAGGFKDYPIGKGYIGEDWEFWARVAGLGYRFAVIPEPLMRYRVHKNSIWKFNQTSHEEMRCRIHAENNHLDAPEYRKKRERAARKSYLVNNPFVNLQTPKTKKKILVALPFMVVGGVDSLFLNVFGHLSQFYEITFYTTVPFGDEYGDNTSLFQKITNEIYHLPRFLSAEKEWKKFIICLIETRNFDCMFLAGSSFTYDFLPEIKKHAPGLPVVDFLFNECGHIENNRKYCHLIDMNIVENEKIEQLLLLNHHEKPEKIRLIHNGVNIEKFSKKADANLVREKYALKEGHFLVAFLGRFSQEKNPFAVIEIAKKLRYQPVEFFMGGNGHQYAELVQQIQENFLQEIIKTPGLVDTIEILSVADVLILPSTLDGRPNIVLEAMAMGVPVIATNVGGLPGIIKHGETGFLFNADDLEEFAQTILKLKNNPLLRETISKAARHYANETLSDTFMHEKWEQVIEDVIETGLKKHRK
jgi:glycosyltransferase involved in cell wall biosynthesis